MARIFITGSADGLGLLAAKSLLAQGHEVVLHARNSQRADDVRRTLPAAQQVAIGDLSVIEQIRDVAEQVNRLPRCDAVIHNAGIYGGDQRSTEAGLPAVFAINTLAPYLLTALIERPARLIYLSSSMHFGAAANLSVDAAQRRNADTAAAYSASKLYVVMLALAVARMWPEVYSNAVDPGWVPTRMGGASAPDDLDEGYRTQVWLAVSNDDGAAVSGKYFHHRRQQLPDPQALDEENQNRLLAVCRELSGVALNRT